MRRSWIQDAERLDVAIYAAVAATPTPDLEAAMSRLTRAAIYSRLSVGAAALLAVAGGAHGAPRSDEGARVAGGHCDHVRP